jgi:Trk-type K+ transport system membrane component
MSRLRRAELWFPLALLVMTAVGGHLLTSDRFVHLSERDRGSYGKRPKWEAAFDALSASCGVGLLTYRLDQDYTPAGRWVLAALGLAGAALYLATTRQILGRLRAEGERALPSTRLILGAFVAAQLIAILVVVLIEHAGGAPTSMADSAWNAVSLFSSLGWLQGGAGLGHSWLYAIVALGGALGWPLWLIFWPGVARPKRFLPAAGSYVVLLLVCAGLISALEVPRGKPRGKPVATERLADQSPRVRFERALTLVTCASGAGVSTEELGDRGVGEGTKLVLAGIVLIGGLGGSVGGGIKWTLLIGMWAATFARCRQGPEIPGQSSHQCKFGAANAQLLLGLVLLVALGLLLIEARTGSAFQSPPTLGDALLDAASAVGGAGLSSGLTATVTNLNLSTGIRQNVDLYQYGMTWLMVAMLAGRVLPVLVLGRLARTQQEPA